MTVLLLHRLRFEQTLGAVKLYVRQRIFWEVHRTACVKCD